jgi:hypothetical protein
MAYKSVRIPNDTIPQVRDIIYIDESGVADLEDKKTKYFILTGVITDSELFKKYNSYYCQLKYKYLGDDVEIHSHELFYNPGKYEQRFIKELGFFIDNIPFCFFTVSVNKNKLINSARKQRVRNPLNTTFRKAISIYDENGKTRTELYTNPVSRVISEISRYSFKDINRYYALEVTYKELLKKYLTDYTKKINIDIRDFEIYFEESPNKAKILKLTEKFKTTGQPFDTGLCKKLAGISFPYKRAKYLGLELADIISFGFNLSLYKQASSNVAYSRIWEAINKRRTEFKTKKSVDMFIKL